MGERKILNISMPEELYTTVHNLAESENKTKAELAREMIVEYITKREQWATIRQWGMETAAKMDLTSEDQLDDLIHAGRRDDMND
jgi:predicted transcriptional regulator